MTYQNTLANSQISLENHGRPWQCFLQVLNTPLSAVATPVSNSGFFASIGFDQWPGSEQPCNSLRVKAAGRLIAVFKYLAALLNTGHLLNNLSGADTMARTKRTRASSRFTLSTYSFIRRFAGPVVAYRAATLTSWRAA